ncbi:MAG: hypothetical protein ACFCD0_12260 [Gemmataceae bacterium]
MTFPTRCTLTVIVITLAATITKADVPTDNPVAKYDLKWTDAIAWNQVIDISNVKGDSLEARFDDAQKRLPKGGVVYFPAGVYRFQNSLKIQDGIVIRGANPKRVTEARKDGYSPPTSFEFPRYIPKVKGNGTPTDTAFKGIYLADPTIASHCGVVNVAINRGHIDFDESEERKCGKNRLVFGCVLRNAAVAVPNVPSKKIGQHPWQRFTARHHAAIHVNSAENALIANNRLPKSGDDNFLQKGYILQKARRRGEKLVVTTGVLFDYDNRPGIYVNDYGIGAGGGNGPAGTPKSHPWGFRKGVEIRDNYIYCSGRGAIAFTGDGTICANNVVRFPKGLMRWTTTGLRQVTGSGTNDNRAVQMRGYRWTVEGNDYVVHSNLVAPNGSYRINDGEGLMHEAHVNSSIKDSKLINNKGNAYISLYRVHGVDGLIVRGNEIHSKGKLAAIFVLSGYFEKKFPCRGVVIENNVTKNSGILIQGDPARNNVVRNNRHIGPGGVIQNKANAKLNDNRGYKVENR